MNNFTSLNLPSYLQDKLASLSLTTPTPIQSSAIPVGLEGKDIIASAQTGTGKTLAFVIPILVKLANNPSSNALVMAPTREIARQIKDVVVKLLTKSNNFAVVLLIGGEDISKQLRQLKAYPRIIVGTPGRINDHLKRNSLSLKQTDIVVLDETDRMLDMGFGVQIDKILPHLPKSRQTLMFSATFPENIIRLSKKYMQDPVRINVSGATNHHAVAKKLKQSMIRTKSNEKYTTLTNELNTRSGTIIVFVNTKKAAENLGKKLKSQNHSVIAFHGDIRQNKRTKIMKDFKDQNFRIMVATDIAARGLDVPHIEHVINYDLPKCSEDYIHRIGRTARASASGSAVSLISGEDAHKWKVIQKMLGNNDNRAS